MDYYFDGFIWINDFQDTYTYNDELVTEILGENWDGALWEPSRLFEYEFTNGMETVELESIWTIDGWENHDRQLSTYDVNGNLETWEWQEWIDGAWVPWLRFNFTATADGKLQESITQSYDEFIRAQIPLD